MIYINRSTDLKNDTVWVAADLNEDTRRVNQLYLGTDVNGAIEAAVVHGMPREDAIANAKRVLDRVRNVVKDEIP